MRLRDATFGDMIRACYIALCAMAGRRTLLIISPGIILLVSLLPLSGLIAHALARGSVEPSPSVAEKSAQQPADSSSAAKNDADVRVLEQGKPIERELAGGQSHAYQITLSAGQFMKVIVEQRGIDVVVELLGPDAKPIMEFNSEIRSQGQE